MSQSLEKSEQGWGNFLAPHHLKRVEIDSVWTLLAYKTEEKGDEIKWQMRVFIRRGGVYERRSACLKGLEVRAVSAPRPMGKPRTRRF